MIDNSVCSIAAQNHFILMFPSLVVHGLCFFGVYISGWNLAPISLERFEECLSFSDMLIQLQEECDCLC